MNNEIKERLFSIIYILVFLTFGTWFIFGPREKLAIAAMNLNNSKINNKDIVISSNDILNYNKESYNFSITNNNDYEVKYQLLLVNDYKKSILNNCKVLSNNYLKYNIKEEGKISIDRNLRLDGIIYNSKLKPYETKKLNLKLWLDKKKNSKDCYYPILKIEKNSIF